MVEAGLLGRKTGRGFYVHDGDVAVSSIDRTVVADIYDWLAETGEIPPHLTPGSPGGVPVRFVQNDIWPSPRVSTTTM